MNARTAELKWTLLAGLVCLLAAGRADAAQTCTNDLDCPDSACGGMVCVRSSGVFACAVAGERGAPGSDGWCADTTGNAVDSNCKCAAQGATCNGFYCTFTMMPDAGATGTGGGGGATGTGGSGTAGSSGGTSAGTGGGGDGGGCSVAGAPALGGTAGIALLLAALLRRRGRRAR